MKIFTCVTGDLMENCYIVSVDGGAVIIDPGSDAEKILDVVKSNNLDVKYILLTHGHFDHIGALPLVKKATGAPVCIHESDNYMLEDAAQNFSVYMGDDACVPGSADIKLKDNDVLTFADTEIKVLHTPGHTPGGACFLINDAMFSGDTLFYLSVGRSDFPSSDPVALDHSLRDVIAALDFDYTVYPGHGEATSLFFEKQNNPYIR